MENKQANLLPWFPIGKNYSLDADDGKKYNITERQLSQRVSVALMS